MAPYGSPQWQMLIAGLLPAQGTTTNDNAAAGNIGEHVSSNIASGSAVALTTIVAADVTSISLTAGDWEVSGWGIFDPDATTNIAQVNVSLSTTTATLGTENDRITNLFYGAAGSGVVPNTNVVRLYTGSSRFSLAATTTVYLVVLAQFTVSTLAAYGHLKARRVR